MPQVYARAGQTDKAITAFERMCSKFPTCRKAWMNYVEFLLASAERAEAARATFAKALKVLPAHKRTRATVKFGQLEFRAGNVERGATVFEQLLQQNASKTDIWSVFFDETIKASTPPVAASADLEHVRALFEKALATKLKPFKMKFFFKRWLDFETKFGDDASVEAVKNRAVEYVESAL
jgi:rRNA biogenesis protein RRP5